MTRYIIIGNGAAGATAAKTIRDKDPDGEITIFSKEAEPFYYRPRLPNFIAGDVDLPKFTLRDYDWYDSNRIDLKKGRGIAKVNLESNSVLTDDGETAAFDKLLLAMGAHCFMPPIAGIDLHGVCSLRTIDDARMLKNMAGSISEAVLVGGGLLGIEAGFGLTRLGVKVHVVEFFDRLLPRQMDRAGAAILQKFLENKGFSISLNAQVKEILGESTATGIRFEDGQTLSGGLVLFSAGVRPNLELAQDMNLEMDKGVKVDDQLGTSADNVWAAGDLVEHRGRGYGIWPAAMKQGEIAGINMAGGSAEYSGTIMLNSLKVAGIDLTSAGNIDADEKLKSAVYVDNTVYRKIVVDDGRICGFIFLGTKDGLKSCQKLLESQTNVGEYVVEMGNKDFDFSKI